MCPHNHSKKKVSPLATTAAHTRTYTHAHKKDQGPLNRVRVQRLSAFQFERNLTVTHAHRPLSARLALLRQNMPFVRVL